MRLISTVLLDDSQVITTSRFTTNSPVGSLSPTLRNLDRWGSDEVIVLDINGNVGNLLSQMSKALTRYMTPLCIGGGIRTLDDAAKCIKNGADRVCIQDLFFTDVQTVKNIAGLLGSQAIVLNLSYSLSEGRVRGDVSTESSPYSLLEHLHEIILKAKSIGIGDIILWSVDSDGIYQNRSIDIELKLCSLHPDTNLIVGGGILPQLALTSRIPSNLSLAFGNVLYLKENYLVDARANLASAGYPLRLL